jgi:hypothetical protein
VDVRESPRRLPPPSGHPHRARAHTPQRQPRVADGLVLDPTAKERKRILADAAAAEEAERREAAASPWLSTVFGKQPVPETELDHTIADLREREKRGEPVDLEEVLAAARAIEQEQSADDEDYKW